MLDTSFDSRKYLDFTHRDDMAVEQKLYQMINTWLDGSAVAVTDRVFVIAGGPGIGKTWLLRNTVETIGRPDGWLAGFRRPRCQTLYINLQERFDVNKYRTAQTFCNYWKAQVDACSPDALCLCVDHVPPSPGDTGLELLVGEILFPALQNGVFLLIAQNDLSTWGLGGQIPHTVHRVSPFSNNGIEKILRQENVPENQFPQLLKYSAGHPLLARYLATQGLENGIKLFLNFWLEQREARISLDELLAYALPLSQMDDFDDLQAGQTLGFSRSKLDLALNMFNSRHAGWIEFYQREDRRLEQRWVPPIKRCLEYLQVYRPQQLDIQR